MRRTRLIGPQGTLWPDWRHFAFLTDLDGPAVEIGAFHRQPAMVELAIDDWKEGQGWTLALGQLQCQRSAAVLCGAHTPTT